MSGQVIASVVPLAGVGNKIRFPVSAWRLGERAASAAFLANLSSLALDFAARQKIGGTAELLLYQAVPRSAPRRYTEADLAFIVPRVLELTYTARDLQPWAEELVSA